MKLPLAQTKEQQEFWQKFRPQNIPSTTDTYKRTMSGSSELFADNFTCYTLAARAALKEESVHERGIMAGLERALYPWFATPVTREEVAKAHAFFTQHGSVKHFPLKAWEETLANEGYLPIDIYALPGGQTYLVCDGKYVPLMSVEGRGALVTHLEPHLENMYAPIIYATKARLFKEAAGVQFAEFGLRSDKNVNDHVTLMHALYVGAGFRFTSDDQTVFLFPEYFKDIGTVGHEFIMAYQRDDLSLEEAQWQAFADFVAQNERSALLPDVIDTVRSGLPEILALVKQYRGTSKVIMPRFDSGDIITQCLIWKRMTRDAGIPETKMVVEDGYTPAKGRETKQAYAAAGYDPEEIIVGAGGYFQQNCVRDTLSMVYKRGATLHRGNLETSLKFSDSPGKGSIPGRIRVYGRGDALIVAQAGEQIPDAEPLMQKVVERGRILYHEDLDVQRARADATWEQYTRIEYSSATQQLIDIRMKEKEAILTRYAAEVKG